MLLWPCRCYRAWFHSNSSWSEWEVLLRKFETLTVCMWCFRIRCGRRVCSTAGRLLENRLHSIIRCLAVGTALSGQLQVGEDVFFILCRYKRKLPWFVRNCVKVKFGHRERESLWSMVSGGFCHSIPYNHDFYEGAIGPGATPRWVRDVLGKRPP
jgi:hypothetical protein